MICFRDRTYCSAFCATAECSRRWTADLQAAARKWWNGQDGAPVAFANFAPTCLDYTDPTPEDPQRELRPGETNA